MNAAGDHPGGIADNDGAVRHIVDHYRAGPDEGSSANDHSREDRGVGSYGCAATDDRSDESPIGV